MKRKLWQNFFYNLVGLSSRIIAVSMIFHSFRFPLNISWKLLKKYLPCILLGKILWCLTMFVTFNAPVPRTIIHFFQIFKKDSELLPSKHIKVETTLITNVHNRCFNVGIRLKRKVESTHVDRCWESSIERAEVR